MSDFDFDFDFDFPTKKEIFVQTDICGLVKKMKSKNRTYFNISKEVKQLSTLIKMPPNKNECYKMLSVGGGFSSLAIIKYIADLEQIENLYVSTFRIGKNHFRQLCNMRDEGKIDNAFFVTSQTQERTDDKANYNGTEYNYYDYIVQKCSEYGWKINSFDNHSKIILMETKKNFYVVETSSNLNENPKMEQFSFENDFELFEWYKKMFGALIASENIS